MRNLAKLTGILAPLGLLISGAPSAAGSDVCVADFGVVIQEETDGGFSGGQADVADVRWVISEIDGALRISHFEAGVVMFDDCVEYVCTRSDDFAGFFIYQPDSHTFKSTYFTQVNNKPQWVSAVGKCSKMI